MPTNKKFAVISLLTKPFMTYPPRALPCRPRCAQGGFGPIVADGSTGQWAEYFDDDGRAYYYNAVTGESQYESPY